MTEEEKALDEMVKNWQATIIWFTGTCLETNMQAMKRELARAIKAKEEYGKRKQK